MSKAKREVCRLLVIALIASLVALFPASAPGQKSGKGRYAGRRVPLQKDARKNGYTTKAEGMEIFFEANDVEDPTTEELLEGMKRLLFRCRPDDPLNDEPLLFTKGRSKRFKVKCSILIEPTVHIIE